jgi:Flp pilus assembly protein TadG
MPGALNQGPAMMTSITNLVRNRRGAAAAAFALALPFMLSGLALAIDYASFRVTHTRMQNAADAAALAAIADLSLDDAAKVEKALSMINANLPEEFGAVTTANDITLGSYTKEGVFTPAVGADVNAARVVAVRSPGRGNAVNRIFSMFISNEALTISTVAIAARPGNVAFEPPEVVSMQGTASHFNELWAYCYDPVNRVRRSDSMGLISNNNRRGPNTTTGMPLAPVATNSLREPSLDNWPTCDQPGDTVSLLLRTYENANANPSVLWTTRMNNRWTDITLTDGVQSSPLFGPGKLVETILCPSLELCTPTSAGGPANTMVVTRERMRIVPKVETKPCVPGSYLYYGFEDIPPPGGDQDYEDISLVLRCPSAGRLGGGKPRLVG